MTGEGTSSSINKRNSTHKKYCTYVVVAKGCLVVVCGLHGGAGALNVALLAVGHAGDVLV